jgi:hypothetical protein
MGNYNPRAPYILGEEWVPIRDEDLVFSPAVNAVEVGHVFTTGTAQQVNQIRFYTRNLPAFIGQLMIASIYPNGSEDRTGPIRRVVVPVTSGGVTGTGFTLETGSVAGDLYNATDGRAVIVDPTNVGILSMFFGTNAYAQELNGKRILAVNLLYITSGLYGPVPYVPVDVYITSDIFGLASGFGLLGGADATLGSSPASIGSLQRVRFGELAHFWGTETPVSTSERVPWTYRELQQFEASATNRIMVKLTTNAYSDATETGTISYAALEVVYCEEQRLITAARTFGPDFGSTAQMLTYTEQTNSLPARLLSARSTNPILAAGTYTVTIASADPGDLDLFTVFNNEGRALPTADFDTPDLNALRELYQIPPHPGVQIDHPFLPEDKIGDVFTQTVTHVLPQISLHTSGGTVLTEPHVYGRQGAAQVWGSNTATQEIYDDIVGVATVYPQVRYYARRFGDTTVPLALTGTGSLSGSSASITVAQFDALTEIVDGWKEVTLRFDTPPTMGTLASPEPSWAWSATNEDKGNRWEILAGCAPAISGLPGNFFNQAPSGQLGAATYQPTAGSTVELTWMPQGVASPYVSGASADERCDAVLIFSQDPPTVTGVAITSLTQTVTGIGLDCGSSPCCIPTGISYQRITWSATSLPATGFGGYELQRFDTTPGATFQTIMLASSTAVTGFSDYEARVGVNSVYRIRALNILNFAGAWSTYVTGAPPTPGVTGGDCPSGNVTGALIFTSNAAQSGIYNAAYVMQWERDVSEDFQLPEAGRVQFQPMYQRDGMVAFHGTERGLEQFTRTLVLQQGAIDPIRLADAKTLRDLAWASLPYVCVRDDTGDRWFANVRVPTVSARNQRKVYLSQIQVTEVTTCPYAVDPS